MKEFFSSSDLSLYLSIIYKEKKTLGFVPTMGALHAGHIQLIKKAKEENDVVLCSVFVNPLQFNNQEDFQKYPSTIERDKQLLMEEQCDFLFLPEKEDLFGNRGSVNFDFGSLGTVMEGVHRPGHFEGMATVVKRFLEIVQPTHAYFGEKDYQQLAIIRSMALEFNLKSTIVPCKTVREKSGLALSSRNQRLSESEKETAQEIYQVLRFCKSKAGEIHPRQLAEMCFERLSANFTVEYFEIADEQSLQVIERWEESRFPRAFTAVYLGSVRLIDNLSLIL